MTNEIGDAKDGLSAMLSTVPGLRVLDHPADALNEFPAAVVMFESRSAARTMRGGAFDGRIKVVVLVSSASSREAYRALDLLMDPSGGGSIEAAVNADNTWGGKVDDGRLDSIDNVGTRRLWGGHYVGADLHFRFTKGAPRSPSPLRQAQGRL